MIKIQQMSSFCQQLLKKMELPLATVKDNDSVIFFNFRPDRAREITRTFCDDKFEGFDRGEEN